MVALPRPPSRLEVTGPYRVLPVSEVAVVWVPCSRFGLGARRTPDPSGLPALTEPRDATPWAFLSWGSAILHGLTRRPCRALSSVAPLMGFLPLQRIRGSEDTYRAASSFGRLVCARRPVPVPLVGPNPPATVPSAGFRNLSTASSSLHRPAMFQAGDAHGVLPFRGLFLPRGLDGSSPPTYPLDVVPVGCASPRPRRGSSTGALGRCLGCAGHSTFGVFRVFVCVAIGLHQRTV